LAGGGAVPEAVRGEEDLERMAAVLCPGPPRHFPGGHPRESGLSALRQGREPAGSEAEPESLDARAIVVRTVAVGVRCGRWLT